MNDRTRILLLGAATGCGGVSVESAELREGSRPIQQAADGAPSHQPVLDGAATNGAQIEELAADEAYACDVVAVSGSSSGSAMPYPFVSLHDDGYAGVCRRASAGAVGCWYTGPRECGDEQPCGGFIGSVDEQKEILTLRGGQHMLCEFPCVSDEQCPAPSSGTALATCMRSPEFNPATDGGSCMLSCAQGETCPAGFLCIEPGLSFGLSDGSLWPVPAQCVQYESVTLSGSRYPP